MQTPVPHEVLVIMARYPEEGAVKTRLARDLGSRAALDLYRAFLFDLEAKFGRGTRPLIWYYLPETSPFSTLFPDPFFCRPQRGDTLQERMLGIFQELFEEGCQKVVVIGADIPHIPARAVDEAFRSLDSADVVLRPSLDGGYHLIGLAAPRDLFSAIPMGTDRVFQETVDRARSMELAVRCLEPSFDVDTMEDVRMLSIFLAESDDPLPRTREVLASVISR